MAMTRAQHRAKAEQMLTSINEILAGSKSAGAAVNTLDVISMAAVAQVHATLSLEKWDHGEPMGKHADVRA